MQDDIIERLDEDARMSAEDNSSIDEAAVQKNATLPYKFVWGPVISLNYDLTSMILVAIILFVVIVATAFGNLLVGVALFRYRYLRTISNYLIGNLALSDFLLATTVLPLSIFNECLGHWIFGEILCNAWLTIDVLCCTASLWNLCVIGFDRFTATVYPMWYRENRSAKQSGLYVALVWTIAAAICVPPVLGWSDAVPNYTFKNETQLHHCDLFDKPSYVLYSACGSFYIPLAITSFFYIRIFIELRARMIKNRKKGLKLAESSGNGRSTISTAVTTCRSTSRASVGKKQEMEMSGIKGKSTDASKRRLFSSDSDLDEFDDDDDDDDDDRKSLQNSTAMELPKDQLCMPSGKENTKVSMLSNSTEIDAKTFETGQHAVADADDVNEVYRVAEGKSSQISSNNCELAEFNTSNCQAASSSMEEKNSFSSTYHTKESIKTVQPDFDIADDSAPNQCSSSYLNKDDKRKLIGDAESSHKEPFALLEEPLFQEPSTAETPTVLFNAKALESLPSYVEKTKSSNNENSASKSEKFSKSATASDNLSNNHTKSSNKPLKASNKKLQAMKKQFSAFSRSSSKKSIESAIEDQPKQKCSVSAKQRRYEQRELRATMRMGIIIAFFCGMWMGFFTVYVLKSWCPIRCPVPRKLDAFFFWLGYSNSSVNPILYTIFNDEFRLAFLKILSCKKPSGGVGRGAGRHAMLSSDRR